jgi:hypothetical protein
MQHSNSKRCSISVGNKETSQKNGYISANYENIDNNEILRRPTMWKAQPIQIKVR